MQIPAFTVPLVGNPYSNNSATNAATLQPIVLPTNATVLLPMTIFLGSPSAATMVTDLGNIVTAELVLRAASTTGDPAAGALMFEQIIPAANLSAALTYAQFQTGTAGHAMFTMSSADTNRPPGNYYLAAGVTTTNAGNVPLLFSNTVTLVDRGIFGGGVPSTPGGISYTEQQSDARYAPVGAVAFAPAITSVGNGASTSLEAQPTVTLAVPLLRTVYDAPNDLLGDWLLVASTAATSLDGDGKPAVQQPLDFNAATNAKVWFRKR